MTNLEAIQANISDVHGVVLTEDHFMKALIDQDVEPYDTYSSASAINNATLTLYDILLDSANFKEGGLSYSISVEGIRQAKASLEKRMGIIPDAKNTITSPKIW